MKDDWVKDYVKGKCHISNNLALLNAQRFSREMQSLTCGMPTAHRCEEPKEKTL
jgi:hypothetical protein